MAFEQVFVLTVLTTVFALVHGDAKRCPTDIVFLVDQSTSITRVSYNDQIIPFLTSVINGLNIGEDGDHVSVTRFSSPKSTVTDTEFENFDKSTLLDAVNNLAYDGGSTATVKALSLAQEQFFASQSARRDSYGKTVAPVVAVITDGVATDGDAAATAQELIKKGVTIFAIGVGPILKSDYLQEITGDQSHVFAVDDASKFSDALVQEIQKSTACA